MSHQCCGPQPVALIGLLIGAHNLQDAKPLTVNEATALLLREGAFHSSPGLHKRMAMWGASVGINGKRVVRGCLDALFRSGLHRLECSQPIYSRLAYQD